jgi:putative colanic acid biosysnthesis UDP-glucose lipid carrier transferase
MASTAPRIHAHRSLLELAHRLLDAAAIVGGLLAAAVLSGRELAKDDALAAAVAIIGFYVVGEITSLYRSWRGIAADRELLCAMTTWGGTLLVLLAAGYATGYSAGLPRRFAGAWAIAAPAIILALRLFVRAALSGLRRNGINTRSFAIIGVNDLAFRLARNIEQAPEMGLKLVGFFDDRPAERTPELPADVGPRVGNLRELVDQARAGRIDSIYITFPMRAEERIRNVLAALGDTTASVYIVPDFFVFELLHARWTNIGGLPAVSVFENPFYGVDGLLKRACDLVLASLFLLLAALPMALIGAAIKLTSRGPVFFRQKRYGLDGREILVWKFRSMRVCEDGNTFKQATKNDPRVTPLGAILRKSSLDELPQLFNVLDGSMSLVGPRPHPNAHNEQFRGQIQGYMLRHKVKPGITGLAQVSGYRGETETLDKMQRRIECDHQYIRDWSLWLDLRILLKTVLVVFKRQNAY